MRITATPPQQQHRDIEYRVHVIASREREHAVVNVLRASESQGTIVFCTTREGVTRLAASLSERGFACVAISGELSQPERTRALQQALRDGRAQGARGDRRRRARPRPARRGPRGASRPPQRSAGPPAPQRTNGSRGPQGRLGDARARRAQARRRALALRRPHQGRVERRARRRGHSHPRRGAPRRVAHRGRPPRRRRPRARPPRAREGRARAARRAPRGARAPEAPRPRRPPAHRRRRRGRGPTTRAGPRFDSRYDTRGRARPAAASSPAATTTTASPAAGYGTGDRFVPPNRDDRGPPRSAPPAGDSSWFTLNVGRTQNADPKWIIPVLCRRGGITKDDIGAIRVMEHETRVEIRSAAAKSFEESAQRPDRLDPRLQIERAHRGPAARPPAAATAASPATSARRASAGSSPLLSATRP